MRARLELAGVYTYGGRKQTRARDSAGNAKGTGTDHQGHNAAKPRDEAPVIGSSRRANASWPMQQGPFVSSRTTRMRSPRQTSYRLAVLVRRRRRQRTSLQISPSFVTRTPRRRCGAVHGMEGGEGSRHYVGPAATSALRHDERIGGRSRKSVRLAGWQRPRSVTAARGSAPRCGCSL